MKKKKMLSLLLAAACVLSLLGGCSSKKDIQTADDGGKTESNGSETDGNGNTDTAADETGIDENGDGEHDVITMQSPFRNATPFLELVKEQYPEINLEIIPYSGKNMTAYVQAELRSGDMPDIYMTSVYTPGLEDVSDRLIDLSGYDFTNNYAESRLRDVADNGAVYMLPIFYNCFGITYNKTLLEQNGWELPKNLTELEELAPKVEEAGYNLAISQIALPGYGFQYLCNILDTSFLNTIDGRAWQRDFLNGTATVKDTPKMTEAFATLEKWKELGMLNGDGDLQDDSVTKNVMAEGKTLFMLGSNNVFKEGESDCEFGLMPYLSEDGTQNALILNVSRYVGLNKHLEDEGNEQKLEDAIHVMEVMSTVEGLSSMNAGFEDNFLLPLKGYVIPEDNYYKANEQELNQGLTAPFIYGGWDNLVVPIGNAVVEYIKGNATTEDIMNAFDDNQSLLKDNSEIVYTTVTEKLDTDDCAKLVGICLSKACGADMALISKNKWYPVYEGNYDLNSDGVSGALFPLPVTDQEIVSILPTGWRGNIKTLTLTGKRVKELAETGYNRTEEYWFPYELITPDGMTIEDETTYTVVICGVTDEVAEEGNLTDTGILGLTAAQEYLGQFETLSKADLRWE